MQVVENSDAPAVWSKEMSMRKMLATAKNAVDKVVAALVFRFVTHYRPDDDEFVCMRIVELWGSEQFPGAADRPLILEDAGLRLTFDEHAKWLAGGHIPVGIGGNINPLDEHGRGDGKSAATMAAEYFGRTEDAALAPILAYSLRADDTATDSPFNKASLIKNLHDANVDVEEIRKMHRRWFDSEYLYFSGEFIFTDESRLSLRQMGILWLKARYTPKSSVLPLFGTFSDATRAFHIPESDRTELARITEYMDRDFERSGFSPFELAGMHHVAQVTGARDGDMIHDLNLILDAKIRNQRDFLAAMESFSEDRRYVDGDERVAVIRSDNNQMQKAARAFHNRGVENGNIKQHLAILLQVRSTGYRQIFSDQERDLRSILARLRAAELAKAGLAPLPRPELFQGGTHPRCQSWFGFEKYGKIIAIFCGSLKTRHHRKTKLTEREIVECIRGGLPHVRRARGVIRDRRDQASAPSKSEALLELIAEDYELYEERQAQSVPSAE